MGKVFSSAIKRPTQNWNLENRAHRILEKKKPTIAPSHNPTLTQQFRTDHPDYLEAQKLKNDDLHKRLEGLVVNPEKMGEIYTSKRPMPEERRPMAELEYGYKEPERISEGHISIKLALDMINKHNSNREVNTPESLAQEYKLNAEDARHILKHFHMLLLQMPLGKDGKPIQVAADTPSGSIGSGQRAGKTLPEPNKS